MKAVQKEIYLCILLIIHIKIFPLKIWQGAPNISLHLNSDNCTCKIKYNNFFCKLRNNFSLLSLWTVKAFQLVIFKVSNVLFPTIFSLNIFLLLYAFYFFFLNTAAHWSHCNSFFIQAGLVRLVLRGCRQVTLV